MKENECKMETYLAFAKMNSKNYHFHLFCQCAGREKCIASLFYNFHSIFHFPCVCFSAKYTKMSWKWAEKWPKNGYCVWWTTLMFFFQVFQGFLWFFSAWSWSLLEVFEVKTQAWKLYTNTENIKNQNAQAKYIRVEKTDTHHMLS